MKKYLNLAAVLASALGAVMFSDVRSANAALVIDLRVGNNAATKNLAPGTDKTVTAASVGVGNTFVVSIYADVYGADADGSNEGVQIVTGSLVNLATGTTTTNAAAFVPPVAPNAAYTGSGYNPGVPFTVGSNVNLGAPNGTDTEDNNNNQKFIVFRAASMQDDYTQQLIENSLSSNSPLPGRTISSGSMNGSEYFLGQVKVTVTGLGTTTAFNWVPEEATNEPDDAFATAALWIEDAQVHLDSKTGQPVYTSSVGPGGVVGIGPEDDTNIYEAGSPIMIIGAATTPEPASLGLLALGGLGLVARRRRKA